MVTNTWSVDAMVTSSYQWLSAILLVIDTEYTQCFFLKIHIPVTNSQPGCTIVTKQTIIKVTMSLFHKECLSLFYRALHVF